ncbi:hypothetical protein [Streptomyces sp. NPDC047108]|uniref:hypothetical protein n=1 Tax=Streptomyces sp. NPDC047108 TaxID=3155025 RepID=UPI0033C29035
MEGKRTSPPHNATTGTPRTGDARGAPVTFPADRATSPRTRARRRRLLLRGRGGAARMLLCVVVLAGAATCATAGQGLATQAMRARHVLLTPCRGAAAEPACAVLKAGIRIFFRGSPTLP